MSAAVTTLLWGLTIILAAGGATLLISAFSSAWGPDASAIFIGLTMLLTAVAIYARKLHWRPSSP
jgi:uncharacterized membrane protein YhaH (DUF805 family)